MALLVFVGLHWSETLPLYYLGCQPISLNISLVCQSHILSWPLANDVFCLVNQGRDSGGLKITGLEKPIQVYSSTTCLKFAGMALKRTVWKFERVFVAEVTDLTCFCLNTSLQLLFVGLNPVQMHLQNSRNSVTFFFTKAIMARLILISWTASECWNRWTA